MNCRAAQREARLLYPQKLPRLSPSGESALGHNRTRALHKFRELEVRFGPTTDTADWLTPAPAFSLALDLMPDVRLGPTADTVHLVCNERGRQLRRPYGSQPSNQLTGRLFGQVDVQPVLTDDLY
jgi:hypothetical protein